MKETTVTDFRCSQEKPTIVFCHGAWHTPAHFEPVQQLFESNGYPTRCPRQPSCGAVPPNVSMYEDARALRLVLEDLVEGQRKYVVLVLHSYGGIVGTQATDHSLAKQTREHLGLPGGVLGLLYMCAFVLPLGQSLQGLLGAPPPHVTIRDDGGMWVDKPGEFCYHDLSPQEQAHWVSEMRVHSYAAQTTPVTYLAYEHHPVTYLFCEEDKAVPVEVQKKMVADCNVHFRTETCTAGHSPYLSQPAVVLDVVKRLIG